MPRQGLSGLLGFSGPGKLADYRLELSGFTPMVIGRHRPTVFPQDQMTGGGYAPTIVR
jgi:hypothetical protein